MVETGKNPNKTKREAGALEPTLGAVIAAYRNRLATRVKRRATDEIIEQFRKGAATPTATEQAFRSASTADQMGHRQGDARRHARGARTSPDR